MSNNSKKNWRYRGYDYLDQCPWCGGDLENGRIQGIRGLRWLSNDASLLSSAFVFGGKYFGQQVAQKCNNCKKTLLLGKKRSNMGFIEEEPPAIRAKNDEKEN